MSPRIVPILLSGLLCSPLALSGQSYWQQQVDHVISVRLDDEAHMLHAHTAFTYTNNSPSALDTLWLHLWPNAYRDRTTALCHQMDDMGELDLHFATQEERGWIDSLDFAVVVPGIVTPGPDPASRQRLTWGFHPHHIDIGWVKLPSPLEPGASITIATPFRVKIPDGKFSRLGHTKQAYYITQWYPKPAVYDASGWHAMPYLTQGEFYSEFGSFDVSITLPANYVVGSTGLLQDNAAEEAWMNERAGQPLSSGASTGFPPSEQRTKTLRFVQDNVHDFAWFADKRFVVRKGEVVLPRSGRKVTTWALFTPKNALAWNEAVGYVNESVRLYSEWVGDYPYDACTAVDGTISAGGGMEYPMITIIGDMDDAQGLDNVIAHEVGHNWFYGILGSNERDHPWMDEGMNSFVELRYMRARYPNAKATVAKGIPEFLLGGRTIGHREISEIAYRINARRNLDQAPGLKSTDFTGMNYGTMVYMKSALAFDHLFAFLGEPLFDRCMHAYYDEWKFKHPGPEDVRAVFERESHHDLGWLFDGLIDGDEKLDVRAKKLKGNVLHYDVNDDLQAPFPVSRQTDVPQAPVWVTPDNTGRAELPWPDGPVRIDAEERTLDIDRRNNTVRSTGLFKRWAPVELKWGLGGIEDPGHRTVHYLPVPLWNGHDGWQAGLVLHNPILPSQRTEWIVAPLYAFGSERLVGGARIEHHFDRMDSRLFQNITIGVSGRTSSTFHDHFVNSWYEKVSPYVGFDLKRDPLSRPWQHHIGVRGVYLNNKLEFEQEGGFLYTASFDHFYTELTYRAEDARPLHPSFIQPTVTYEYDFLRASLELKQAFAYNGKNDQLRLRAFAGAFLWKRDDRLFNPLHAWGLSWGPEDMLYDHAYFERNAFKGFTARQFNKQQGAFKTPFLQGGSDTWIGALNAELDLPLPLPFTLFGSFGMVPVTFRTQSGTRVESENYFEAGIGLQVFRDGLEIWLPFVVSDRIKDEEEFLDRGIIDRVRFVIALEKLDPGRAVRRLRP